MTPDTIVDIFREGLYVTVMLVSFLVVPGLLVGLMVAMFQAATQINEMSLSFVPKLLVTFLVLLLGAPWLLKVMLEFTRGLIMNIPSYIG